MYSEVIWPCDSNRDELAGKIYASQHTRLFATWLKGVTSYLVYTWYHSIIRNPPGTNADGCNLLPGIGYQVLKNTPYHARPKYRTHLAKRMSFERIIDLIF